MARRSSVDDLAMQAFRAFQSARSGHGSYGHAAMLFRKAAVARVTAGPSKRADALMKQTKRGLTKSASQLTQKAGQAMRRMLGMQPAKKVRKPKQHKGPVTPEMLGESQSHGSFQLKRGAKGGLYYIGKGGKKVYVK